MHKFLYGLFNNDRAVISSFEEPARDKGYGPLAPCNYAIPFHSQREYGEYLCTYVGATIDLYAFSSSLAPR